MVDYGRNITEQVEDDYPLIREYVDRIQAVIGFDFKIECRKAMIEIVELRTQLHDIEHKNKLAMQRRKEYLDAKQKQL